MKTIVIESTSPLSWYFIADSALVNAGKPFFIPEFADEFEAFLAPVVRINRIGKSIGARFAERYYTEIAPAVHFRASKLRQELLSAGLPTDPSHSFDRAMTVGTFLPTSEFFCGSPLIMLKNEEVAAECNPVEMKSAIRPLLEAVSRSNTIKMGDYLVPQLSKPVEIGIGDTLNIALGTEILLTIHIK
ncbi:MAG: hypothetical protein K2J78_04290 [Muribaculaceae bacterium]|nr:hypothetical protein [Muribaculaceae bacterium]